MIRHGRNGIGAEGAASAVTAARGSIGMGAVIRGDGTVTRGITSVTASGLAAQELLLMGRM